jgi:hypothetical protein
MRLASFEKDFWELKNGEDSHAESPATFWLPELEKRKNLKRGDAAKLMFAIECESEDGSILIQTERMYVIVSEICASQYIGILDHQPVCVEKGNQSVYLCFGAEIAFSAEHVIDIVRPPQDYIEWQLGQPPDRVWPRK